MSSFANSFDSKKSLEESVANRRKKALKFYKGDKTSKAFVKFYFEYANDFEAKEKFIFFDKSGL